MNGRSLMMLGLAVAFGLVPATALRAAPTAPEADAASRGAARDRLLRELLALERRRATGEVTEEQFKQTDMSLRRRLRALLADSPTLAAEASTGDAATDIGAPVDAPTASGGGMR